MKRVNHVAGTLPSPQELGPYFSTVLKKMDKMTTNQLFETMVATGIYTEAGKLVKEYGGRSQGKK